MNNKFDYLDDDVSPESLPPLGDDLPIIDNVSMANPTQKRVKAHKRRLYTAMQRESLMDFIKELPPPGEDIWIIGNGSGATYGRRVKAQAFEFGHFIPVLIDLLGGYVESLYISTWTMNRHHAENILQIYDEGKAGQIAVMTDPYFLKRESFVSNMLKAGLLARGQRIMAFKNHTKIIAMVTPGGDCAVIQGSANLSSTPRAENWILTTNPDVYSWVVNDFFEVMLNGK